MAVENKPKVRFVGFEGEWEKVLLGRLVEFYSGLTYTPNDVSDEGTFVLRSSNVKGNQIIDADNVYVNPMVVNSTNVERGDIVVVVRNGSRDLIGKHAQVKKDMPNTVIGAFMTGVKSEYPNFTNALLDTEQFKKEVHKNLGATINQITTGVFKAMKFIATKSNEEQEQIGTLFELMDERIRLHKERKASMEEAKKSYMQKMFPKGAAKEPEMRFGGFDGEWEAKRLSEILKNESSKKYIVEASDEGEFPVIQQGDKPVVGYSNYPNPISNYDDFILFGDHTLSLFKPNCPFFIATDGIKLLTFLNYDACFGYVTLQKYMPKSEGYKRHFTILKNTQVTVSNNTKEQQLIGAFFQALDEKIQLEDAAIEQAERMKKASLQMMFV